jgi:uncharacterized protein YuzE
MRLTYDERGRVAYLELHGDEDVGPVSSETFRPPDGERADDYFVLDFDADGRLVGIEILCPDERLLPSVVAGAQRQQR